MRSILGSEIQDGLWLLLMNANPSGFGIGFYEYNLNYLMTSGMSDRNMFRKIQHSFGSGSW